MTGHFKVLRNFDGHSVGQDLITEVDERTLAFVNLGFLELLGGHVGPVANPRRSRRGVAVHTESGTDQAAATEHGVPAGEQDS